MANWVADFIERNPEIARLPVHKRVRNGIHHLRADGLIVANLVGFSAHVLDSNGRDWIPSDTALKVAGAEFGAPGIPIRFRADGRVAVGTHVQRTERIGLFNPVTKAFSALATLGDGLIVDDTLVRASGIFEECIRLTEDGVREELVVSEMPSGGSEDWLVSETRIQGGDFADGEVPEFSRAGYQFPLPSVRDANGKRLPAKRFARKIGAAQYLLTGVPLAALAQAKFPVVLDPDFASSTSDGGVEGLSATYATARSTATGIYTITVLYVGQQLGYYIERGFVSFDTSSIGAGSTVTQANLTLVSTVDNSATDFDVIIMRTSWAAQDPLDAGNKDAAYDGCLAGTQDDNIWRNTSGMSANTQYASGNLNTAYVSKTGKTYYSLISSRDLAGTTPSGDEVIAIATFDHATSAYRPVLTVLFSADGGQPAVKRMGGVAFAHSLGRGVW